MSVFDFDELDVFHFFILPLEGDAPRGFAGICIDGVAGGAIELVVVKGWGEKESFFIRRIEQGETFERLVDVESAEFPDLAAGWFFAEEDRFCGWIGEALNHGGKDTQKREHHKRGICFFVYSRPWDSRMPRLPVVAAPGAEVEGQDGAAEVLRC